MKISGLDKLTLLDYPEKLACIIFTQGCNFKCPFCQNSDLIKINNEPALISEEEIFNYLKKRKNVLDGVVITGGEPTIQPDLIPFIERIKALHLKVKLDTNGFKPDVLNYLINEQLIDYVAMDIKNVPDKYGLTTGINGINIKNILTSIAILKSSKIDHEFRTTIIKEHHTIDDLKNIVNLIGKDSKYYLQDFKDSEYVLDKSLHGFNDTELHEIENELNEISANVKVRGL
jgi:pyruvate formate lyase activating enzyme